ncbi:hypothetical protein ACJWV3_07360, partial [Klebsiella pneumoniae]
QTETEATGAPQKHHYTLNQQVGSITQGKEISPLPARVSKSDGIFWSRDVYHKAKESGGGNAWP